MIHPTFSMFLWAQRSELYNSGPGLLEMPHLRNTVEISFCPSPGSFKHSILTQIKMTFPKVLLTRVIPQVLHCHRSWALVVSLCWTTAGGAQRQSASSMGDRGNHLLDALKRQQETTGELTSRWLALLTSRLVLPIWRGPGVPWD